MAETPDEVGEGKQLQLLKVLVRKAYEDVVSGISEDEFFKTFSVLDIKRKTLALFLEKFKTSVVKGCVKEFNSTTEEESIDEHLRMREELLQQQKGYVGTVAWRPSGSVSNDIRAHDMSILKAKSEQLSVMLDQEERKANEMFLKVSKARQRMQQYQMELANKRETVNKLIDNVEHQEEADVKLLKTLTGPTMM